MKQTTKGTFQPAYKTLAIMDETAADPETKVNKPSLNAVKEGKDWVDANEK